MNNQKGVSLIITFFIMTILLALVLGISTILFNEIKIIGNIGNSVSALYAADAGIEKTLFYDNKVIPDGGHRGICNICNTCATGDCNSCTAVGTCDPITCSECDITYSSTLNGISYDV